jgi:hypothetical protein
MPLVSCIPGNGECFHPLIAWDMKFDEYQEKLAQLKKLIAFANTGTPGELARTLNVSERTARRLVEKLKLQNQPIIFCRKLNSYVLKE